MSTTTELPTGVWQIDPAATTVTITVKKLGGLITVPATLDVTAGVVRIDEQHKVTDVTVTVDAGSYRSKNDKRNEHVVSKDFLDSENHPTITFEANSITVRNGGHHTTGTVTVKGRSTPIEVAISAVNVDGESGSFTATATTDRTALGVDKMPGFIVGQELTLEVAATAHRSAQA